MENMHAIQRHILKNLTVKGRLRYRDLKPQSVEGNQFMYHMKVLVDKSYVEKDGMLYRLTVRGKRFADKVSLESFMERVQPKIVTMIYCANPAGEVLLYKRAREPFRGTWSLPYGKMHMGEKVADAAHRELSEKTGLTAKLTRRGDAYLAIYEKDQLITHMLTHIFEGSDIKAAEKKVSEQYAWMNLAKVKAGELFPGFKEILKAIEKSKNSPFFEEFIVHI